MRTENFEQFIYAPMPLKGYSIRASSKSANPQHYKERCRGYFVPVDPTLFREGTAEALVIMSDVTKNIVYFSRLFRVERLDERGRSGFVSHTVIIPLEILKMGLPYITVEAHMKKYIESQIPTGEIPQLSVTWEEGKDRDLEDVNSKISKKSLERIIGNLRKEGGKVFVIAKDSTTRQRMDIAYVISKVVDIRIGIRPLAILTEPPLPLIRDLIGNVVISRSMISLPPKSPWAVIKPFPDAAQVYQPIDEKKIESTLDEIYK